MTGVVLTVGNVLMGDDGAGPWLAERLEADPAPGWQVVDGGSAPENVTHVVRGAKPDRVLIVDAARMGRPAGSVLRIDPATVADHFLLGTHAIPLDFLVASLEETVPEVILVGIEPARVAFYEEMTAVVRAAVDELHHRLKSGEDPADLPIVG
jgi:hydrogenase 3 maturation protease